MKRNCNNCDVVYEADEKRVKHNRNLFCSIECSKRKLKKPNFIICKVCECSFHRVKSLIKSENIFCSIECKSKGMVMKLTKSMRKGTGVYDIEAPIIRNKFYRYKKFDFKKYKTSLDYSIDDFIFRIKNGECFYCGERSYKLGLDRIDNNKGHILNNTVVCCELCNMTRGNRYSIYEMKMIGEIIKKIKDKRNYEKC